MWNPHCEQVNSPGFLSSRVRTCFAPKAIAKQRKGKTPSDNVWGASGVATSARHLDFFSARIPTGLSAIFLARPFHTTKSVRVLKSRYRAKSSDLRFSGTTKEIRQAVPEAPFASFPNRRYELSFLDPRPSF